MHRHRASGRVKLARPVSCTGKPRVQRRPPGGRERYASIVGKVSIMELAILLCVGAVAVEPKIMQVMIRCPPMGASGWFKAHGERQQRVNQNLHDGAAQYKLQIMTTVRSVQERQACRRSSVRDQEYFRAMRDHYDWRSSSRRRCKARPRFEGASAPCVIAAYHGYWDRADINFVDVGIAMPPAILDAVVATTIARHGRQHDWSDALFSVQRQQLDMPSTKGSAGDPRARDWQTSGVRSAGPPTAPLQPDGLFFARSPARRLQ